MLILPIRNLSAPIAVKVAFVIDISDIPSTKNSNLLIVVDVRVNVRHSRYQRPVDNLLPSVPI